MTAHKGRGEELAAILLEAADELTDDPGCELYLVNRQADDPDTIWVTEVWRDQAALDANLERIRGSERVTAALALVERGEAVELEALGGKGPAGVVDPGEASHTVWNLLSSEDAAAKGGLEAMGEARFPNRDLGTHWTGVSLQRLRAGARQPFGHRHRSAEEVYVVLSGTGRARLDDEIVELGPMDAVRLSPQVIRAFEAGPDGELELLVFGNLRRDDGEVIQGWWKDEA